MSRKGKHKDGKVSIGIYATIEFKALLAYLVDVTGMTATDIIMDGVRARAIASGVLDSHGNIKPAHKGSVDLLVSIFKAAKNGGK